MANLPWFSPLASLCLIKAFVKIGVPWASLVSFPPLSPMDHDSSLELGSPNNVIVVVTSSSQESGDPVLSLPQRQHFTHLYLPVPWWCKTKTLIGGSFFSSSPVFTSPALSFSSFFSFLFGHMMAFSMQRIKDFVVYSEVLTSTPRFNVGIGDQYEK